jgi:hypothetical protein
VLSSRLRSRPDTLGTAPALASDFSPLVGPAERGQVWGRCVLAPLATNQNAQAPPMLLAANQGIQWENVQAQKGCVSKVTARACWGPVSRTSHYTQ